MRAALVLPLPPLGAEPGAGPAGLDREGMGVAVMGGLLAPGWGPRGEVLGDGAGAGPSLTTTPGRPGGALRGREMLRREGGCRIAMEGARGEGKLLGPLLLFLF